MEIKTVGVTKDYVKKIIASDEFRRQVLKESDEDVYDEDFEKVEENDYLIIYKYVVYGELCYKLTFYCIDK